MNFVGYAHSQGVETGLALLMAHAENIVTRA